MRSGWQVVGVVLAVVASGVGEVYAQGTTDVVVNSAIQIDPFEPMPFGKRSMLNLSEPDVLDSLEVTAGLFTHRAQDLLVLSEARQVVARPLAHQQRVEALVAMGLFGFADVGVVVPAVVDQQGDLASIGRQGVRMQGGVLGDVRATARVRLLNPRRKPGIGLAVSGTAYFPSGDTGSFNSDGDVRWEARLSTGWYHPTGLGLAVNVARHWRPERTLHNFESGEAWRWGVGLRAPTTIERLTLLTTLSGSALASKSGFDTRGGANSRPIELLGAAQIRVAGDTYLTVGGGRGMSSAVGAPAWRGFLSFRMDGIGFGKRRKQRALAEVAEEPMAPEVAAAIEEIPAEEEIPTEEAVAYVEHHDAPVVEAWKPVETPEITEPVVVDEEPVSVADFDDTYAAFKMTPDESDSDGDGIPDYADPCPREAEDVDGFEDADGCPDLDNDGEGIVDTEDACPDEPETVNGYKDTDGCPDTAPRVRIVADRIQVDGEIGFRPGTARILPASRPLLDEIAELVRSQHNLVRLAIEGYTDTRGNYEKNHQLSEERAEAVWDYLVGRGVKPTVLVTAGYGELFPQGKNATRSGRAENRRVDFRIVETSGELVQ